jgi:hypothetical protein
MKTNKLVGLIQLPTSISPLHRALYKEMFIMLGRLDHFKQQI